MDAFCVLTPRESVVVTLLSALKVTAELEPEPNPEFEGDLSTEESAGVWGVLPLGAEEVRASKRI